MFILSNLLLLLFLFFILGISADFSVRYIKYIGSILKIRLFAFGILLGLVTTLPELSLGINATIDQATTLSVGNLLGGIIVMLGLILGASLLFNRNINTDGRLSTLIPTVLVIFSPIILGVDGKYSLLDGLIMVFLYLGLILYLNRLNRFINSANIEISSKEKVTKSIIFVIAGIIGILLTSHWIIKITLDILNYINISQLIIGLIIFSIGTNLPEISIAISSFRKKSSELSLSHLLSSAFTNVLVLGIIALFQPIVFELNLSYWILSLFFGIILILFTFFYYSNKKMNHVEGAILLSVYILFIITNIYLGGIGK